ncbi:putative homeodomain transcription factor 1 [Anneissia japonica]|uniref:putative homeodomain transcription factor 1 n=1 Tax=Anneissia japonica TaxID=1529436 RepID=UPI001425ABFC|nr:putative homeodomain transcription factor 1 [Anneissia japonica]XP_033127675.1 putative homeodomain transcription factor 1 [Anneissia japonica]
MDALTAGLHDAIVQFQKKIGAYDKDLWEEYMEETELQEFGKNTNAPMKSSRVKTELIDVDLFRGSNFTKAKPEYAWIGITRRGITRVIFYPFCYKWWITNISCRLFLVFLTLYAMQVISMVIYLFGLVSNGKETVPFVEVFSPVILMLILGTTYCQVVSTKVSKIRHLQRKSSRRKFKINYKNRKNQEKRNKSQQNSNANLNSWSNFPKTQGSAEETKQRGKTREALNVTCLRRRIVSLENSGRNLPDNTSVENSKAVSINKSEPVYVPTGDEDVNCNSDELLQCMDSPIESMEPVGDIIISDSIDDNFEELIPNSSSCSPEVSSITFQPSSLSNSSIKECFSYIPGSGKDEQIEAGKHNVQEIGPTAIKEEDMKLKSPLTKTLNMGNGFSTASISTESEGDDLWMDKGDDGSSPSSSETSDSSESDEDSEEEEPEGVVSGHLPKHENPFCSSMASIPVLTNNSYSSSEKEKVGVRLFMGNECKKTEMTVVEISYAINHKVDSSNINKADYLLIGFVFSALIAIVPVCYRLHTAQTNDSTSWMDTSWLFAIHRTMFGSYWSIQIVTATALVERFVLSLMYFFMLAVAERTYKQRCLFAKYFTHLTSARRARKSSLPHFRLDRVSSIKAWLALRSFLKKRGPQRSVDVIVTSTFLVTLLLISLLCTELLHDSDRLHSELHNWEVVMWSFCLSVYLLRFVTLGSEINKKFRNSSLLLTEQINLYLRMERKPKKKDELMLANNVLKLASKLLKELESPFKISGLSMNPIFYNIIRVVVLSAFSAVLSEVLGFKLKLWKIKT